MKSTFLVISMPVLALFLGAQPAKYTVTDLGPSNNPFSVANWIDNFGLTAGLASASDGSQHAVLWLHGTMTDLGKPGLGGPNSIAGSVNDFGQVLGQAETSSKDPNKENFCGFGTAQQCLSFVWQYGGTMTALPTLGGTNASYGAMNNVGEVVGIAETSHKDPACPATVAINGTGPQVLDFEAVIWGPQPGQIRQLSPLAGDTVGMAFGINDLGQVVGTSGTCGNTVLPGFAAGPHAVLWERDGSVHDLGSLGGTVNTSILGPGNVAFVINNRGEVSGQSTLPGNATFHPFLWSRATGMLDLGVLPGDLVGAGIAMNNHGDIVGASVSAPGPATGNPRAFLWKQGVMTDLNSLIPATSPLYLLTACGVNDAGVIVGFGVTESGDIHGFMATPAVSEISEGLDTFVSKAPARPAFLSESARKAVLGRLGMRGR
jgi:probable HAF family extracellular repeat protein